MDMIEGATRMAQKSDYHTYPVICYANDGNTAVRKNKRLKNTHGNIYIDHPQPIGYEECSIQVYAYFPEIPVALWIGRDYESNINKWVPRTLEDTMNYLKAEIKAQERISNVELELISMAEPDLLESAKASREAWLTKKAAEVDAHQAEMKERRMQEVKDATDPTAVAVDKALATIRNGGYIMNEQLYVYDEATDNLYQKALFLILFDKYNVNIRPRTRGWVKDGLARVKYENGKAVATAAWKGHGTSESIYTSLDALAEAVKEAG